MDPELKRSEQTTEIYLSEDNLPVFIRTYSPKMIKRLTAFSKSCPELCRLTQTENDGGRIFEVDKHRLSIRLTKPYSAKRRQAAREAMSALNTAREKDKFTD